MEPAGDYALVSLEKALGLLQTEPCDQVGCVFGASFLTGQDSYMSCAK